MVHQAVCCFDADAVTAVINIYNVMAAVFQ